MTRLSSERERRHREQQDRARRLAERGRRSAIHLPSKAATATIEKMTAMFTNAKTQSVPSQQQPVTCTNIPEITQYRDFVNQNYLIGNQTIDTVNLCSKEPYCLKTMFGDPDISSPTPNNQILCDNCKKIGDQLNTIYYNYSPANNHGEFVQDMINTYRLDYCSLFNKNNDMITNMLTANKDLNGKIKDNRTTILDNNKKITKQQYIIKENIDTLSQLNKSIISAQAQNELSSKDNVYIGIPYANVGFEVSSQTYFWTVSTLNVILIGGAFYYFMRKRNQA